MPIADGSPCEDGDLCSVRDRCQAGRCQGQARICDDGFAGVIDRCNTRTGECEPGEPCGDDAPYMPIEAAVRDFVTHHLSPPDPYL